MALSVAAHEQLLGEGKGVPFWAHKSSRLSQVTNPSLKHANLKSPSSASLPLLLGAYNFPLQKDASMEDVEASTP